MKDVRVLRPFGPHSKGEILSLNSMYADDLVARGFCVVVDHGAPHRPETALAPEGETATAPAPDATANAKPKAKAKAQAKAKA